MVERIERPVEGNSSTSDPATYTIRPTHVWKGGVADVFIVSSEVSGAACGLEGIAEGDDVVLFASEGTDGIHAQDITGLIANLCGGTALVDVASPGEFMDPVGGDEPGAFVWPTGAAVTAVMIVGGVIAYWWILPRHRQ